MQTAVAVAVTCFILGYVLGTVNEHRMHRRQMKEWRDNLMELSRLMAQERTGE